MSVTLNQDSPKMSDNPIPTSTKFGGIKDKIVQMLGTGLSAEIVASATGVSPSYISQLMSDQQFSSQVITLRMANISEVSARDKKYDALEDKLLEKADSMIPFIHKPGEIFRFLTQINAAKRKGSFAPDTSSLHNSVVINLTLPDKLVAKYKVDINNQVIEVGELPMVTMSSGSLAEFASFQSSQPTKELSHVPYTHPKSRPIEDIEDF